MAYTVEITDGSTTYTFDVTRVPAWGPLIESEYDETKFPAVQTKRVDTLTLEGCSFRHATPANVTTDWTTIRGQLFDRTTPITAVTLKDDSTTIDALNASTHDQIMIQSLKAESSPGLWANHWRGTIVIRAVKFQADGDGIVRKVRKLTYSHDQHGFETRRLEVELVTAPGTSAAEKIALEALELPSSKWFYTTNSDDGIDYTLEEDSEDTHARGVSEIREQALTLPAGSNEYDVEVTTEESGNEKELRYTITAQAGTLARALAIVRAAPAPSAWTRKTTREERRINRASATFVVVDDGSLRVTRWTLRVRGGGREREAIRFPSIGGKRRPIPFLRPAGEYVFEEEVTVRQRGVPHPPVPSVFASDADLETAASADDVAMVAEGSTPAQNLYERSVVRAHVFFGDPPPAAALLGRMLTRPYPNQRKPLAYEIAEQRRA